MCRLALQLLGILGNVLGRPRHAFTTSSACFARSLADLDIYGSLVVHYSLVFTAYKAASRGVSLRCGTPKILQKHAKVGQGCKACLGRCKACRGQPRTLPSMPRSCKASLHILSFHISHTSSISQIFLKNL